MDDFSESFAHEPTGMSPGTSTCPDAGSRNRDVARLLAVSGR